jgi:competence protein ComFC
MHELFQDMANFILDFAFPKFCFGCQKEGSFLCDICRPSIPYLEYQFCIMCNKPSRAGFTHPGCLKKMGPDQCVSVFSYQTSPVSEMIIAGKYYFVPEIFQILGNLAASVLTLSEPKEFYAICPLPLHKRRLRWRGFNQASVISKQISMKFSIPIIDCLIRKKATKTQKDLSQIGRIKNVRNAFEVKEKESIKNKHVLLIDDVVTTGMTLRSATNALKKAGAQRVTCLTIARD